MIRPNQKKAMAKQLSKQGRIAREFLEQYADMSINAISQLLFERHPTLFKSQASCRSALRYHSGTQTVNKNSANPIKRQTLFTRENPFGLPESKANIRQFVKIENAKRVLWLSDIHFPNQDNEALTAALQYGLDHHIDCIVLGGDILDNEPFTSHDAPPPLYSEVRQWFDMVDGFLDMLIEKFNCPIHWIEGNHDNWYKRYLMKKAPALFHDEYYTLSSRLKLREKKITWHDQNVILMAGKLPMTHGHMIVRGIFSPVNPARGVYMKIKSSMLIGHCHTTSEHSESILNHELITTYSTGCLCELAPNYDPFNTKHNQGFAMIEINENGNYRVHNKRIDYLTKEIY
jgi:predicted phosphodiesterase